MPEKTVLNVTIRRITPKDVAGVLKIPASQLAWSERTLTETVMKKNYRVWVAAHPRGAIVGFIAWRCEESHIVIRDVIVQRNCRRMGVGRLLTSVVSSSLFGGDRLEAWAEVPERNVKAQLFFRAMQYKAAKTLNGDNRDDYQDIYRMIFTPPAI
jgi:ribosomal protein S18 acetylase RimI-like enzyme